MSGPVNHPCILLAGTVDEYAAVEDDQGELQEAERGCPCEFFNE